MPFLLVHACEEKQAKEGQPKCDDVTSPRHETLSSLGLRANPNLTLVILPKIHSAASSRLVETNTN
jgi:hypothetical protein